MSRVWGIYPPVSALTSFDVRRLPVTLHALEIAGQSARSRRAKKYLLFAAVLAVAFAAVAGFALKAELIALVDRVVAQVREAGPAVFFAAMALLPAVGFPMVAFTLAAGPVFGPTLGAGGVIVCAVIAVVVNLLLTYWLADRALRPLVTRLLAWFEVRLPQPLPGGAWQLALIVRLTPGPPFWMQSYLLGLLRVPLAPYLVVSTLVMTGYIAALVLGGTAMVSGNGRLAFLAIAIFAVAIAVLQLLRQRTRRQSSRVMLAAAPAK